MKIQRGEKNVNDVEVRMNQDEFLFLRSCAQFAEYEGTVSNDKIPILKEITQVWEDIQNHTPKPKTLDDAFQLAVDAHFGQVDKAGKAYIDHPKAVLRIVKDMFPGVDIETQMVAILHDVVEDTTVTLKDISDQGYPPGVVVALDFISRRDGEPYGDYIDRVCKDRTAMMVKMADLKHNSDLDRLYATKDVKLASLMKRYAEAYYKVRAAFEADPVCTGPR